MSKDPIVDLIIKMKPPIEVKYDKQSLLEWYIQTAIELTRKEIMSQFMELDNSFINYKKVTNKY